MYIPCVQHTMNVYHCSIEKVVHYDKENKINATETVNEFLRPLIERAKVTKYGNEAIIEIGGQQLWFVHSMDLSSNIKLENPIEVKELSICFKMNVDDIHKASTTDQKVILFSYFCHPVEQEIEIEVEVMKLSVIQSCVLYY